MKIEKANVARAGHIPLDDVDERPARPGRLAATIEQAVGVVVLAAGDGTLKRHLAVFSDEVLELGIALSDRLDVPLLWNQYVVKPVVFHISRACDAMVDKIAIEIDVVLSDAPQPGEAVRVDGMNKHQSDVLGDRTGLARGEQSGQHPRSAEPLDTVGRRIEQQHAACVGTAEARDVGEDGRSVGCGRRVLERLDDGAGSRRGR